MRNEISLPRHIAFVMDGNGRWAVKHGLPRSAGHRAGAETFIDIAKGCAALGIGYMSVYAFSTENWSRPSDEVQTIMKLAVEFLQRGARELEQSNIRVRFLGDLSALPAATRLACENASNLTKYRNGMVLNIALNYGGRAEIARAAQKIAQQVRQGALSIDEIGEKTVADNLDTAGQPDVDLLVRTGGENRLSGFLLYQCSYAELFVQQTLWPDFSMQELQAILHSYSVRERRYGNIPAQEVP